ALPSPRDGPSGCGSRGLEWPSTIFFVRIPLNITVFRTKKVTLDPSLDEQAVRPARGDAGHRRVGGGQRRHRAGPVGGGAVAELAGGVVAPGERRPAGLDGEAVEGAAG